jgi:hypothetical protein
MSDTEKQFDDMARKGRWGDAERYARLVEFLVVEGRVEDFLSFVQSEEKDQDAYLAKTGPEAFEREALRYLEESGASLASLQSEAEENPVCDSRDHF